MRCLYQSSVVHGPHPHHIQRRCFRTSRLRLLVSRQVRLPQSMFRLLIALTTYQQVTPTWSCTFSLTSVLANSVVAWRAIVESILRNILTLRKIALPLSMKTLLLSPSTRQTLSILKTMMKPSEPSSANSVSNVLINVSWSKLQFLRSRYNVSLCRSSSRSWQTLMTDRTNIYLAWYVRDDASWTRRRRRSSFECVWRQRSESSRYVYTFCPQRDRLIGRSLADLSIAPFNVGAVSQTLIFKISDFFLTFHLTEYLLHCARYWRESCHDHRGGTGNRKGVGWQQSGLLFQALIVSCSDLYD